VLRNLKKFFGIGDREAVPQSDPVTHSKSTRPANVLNPTCEFQDALAWVVGESPELWEGQMEEVLAAVNNPHACGPVLRFTTPTAGFVAAADTGEVFSMGFMLTTTVMRYEAIERILYAPLFTESEGAMAFAGNDNGEDVSVSAVISEDNTELARQFVMYVSAISGIEVDVRTHEPE
jgi:hypothetical protein